jgi:alkanesulfonate monooxygenase SsuD/methylene tetrahydromethanopterin reductase-like flavin-dependent oxidoreductase (luciferase family)
MASVGDQMQRLAATTADGVVLSAACSPAYVKRVQHKVDKIRESSHLGEKFEIVGFIIAAVSSDPRVAKDNVRKHVAENLGRPKRAEQMLPQDLIDEKRIFQIQEYVRRGEIAQAARLLDERWIDCVAAAGTVDEVVDFIERMVANGVTMPAIIPEPAEMATQVIEQISGRLK